MGSTHGKLRKLDKHPYYYVDSTSQRIYYVKRSVGKVSTRTTSITEAKKFIEDYLIRKYSSNPSKTKRLRAGITNPKISDIWTDVLEDRSIRSEGTKNTYHTSWEYGIAPYWANKTVAEVTRENVVRFEKWYLKAHPKRTFFNTRKHLLMLFNFMKAANYISEVPQVAELDEIISQNHMRPKVGRVYTAQELEALVQVSDGKNQLAIMMGFMMGMRKMEILSRKWEEIKPKDQILNVWSTKNKKWREVPIPSRVIVLLKEIQETAGDSAYIFPMSTNGDRHISGQIFDKAWKRIKRLANLEGRDEFQGARIHDLRHTFATMTARDNWPPLLATKILDMSLEEYERTYVHLTQADARKVMMKSLEGIQRDTGIDRGAL